MLYRYDLLGYAFSLGAGIRAAVADGASVVNISAGFPCRVANTLGLALGICTTGEITDSCFAIARRLTADLVEACLWINVIDPIILGPLVCGVAAAAVATATTACFVVLIEGTLTPVDVRSPIRTAVDDATVAGVPVVSIAGNDIVGTLDPTLQALVDADERRAEAWEIIPCTLPNVICVGSAQSGQHPRHDNVDFFGDAVDIWAPSTGQYWAPEDVDDLASAMVRQSQGASTSSATGYISGTIALLMAVDPDLDPQHTLRTGRALSLIPGEIVVRLQGTGTLPDAMTPNRGTLVNPFNLIEQALTDISFNLWRPLNYVNDYDLLESTPAPSDTSPGILLEPPFPSNPHRGSVHTVPG
ncbi:MAG: S8/S53 family peptidase, partial [Actinomycetota bacterium]